MINVWLFPKWYPNRVDPQLGVFIQKHARAIALKNTVSVLYVQSLDGLTDNNLIEQQQADRVNEVIIYYKKDTGLFRHAVNLFRYLSAMNSGIKILNRTSPLPDVLLAYILLRPAIVAWYLSIKMNVPFIISEQWSGYVTGKFQNKSFIRKSLTRWIVKRASALTSVSKFLLKGMEKNGLKNENTFIIPNCIEINQLDSSVSENNISKVLIVADLVDNIKNISGVIKMIASLENQKPFELYIVGHGPDERKLKSLVNELNISSKIFFEGLKTNKQVYEYLNRCNFLIMNSRFETFSLICAEAMSCGKPVLATKCGGPDEFVTNETGILIQPDEPEELKAAFLEMLNNFNNYDPVKITAHSSKLFSMEIASEGFDKVFQSVDKQVL